MYPPPSTVGAPPNDSWLFRFATCHPNNRDSVSLLTNKIMHSGIELYSSILTCESAGFIASMVWRCEDLVVFEDCHMPVVKWITVVRRAHL